MAVRPAIPDTLEADTTAVVFLTTNPINADVLLDGRPLQEQTPLLLRGLEPGVHELEIRKRGYRTEQRGDRR